MKLIACFRFSLRSLFLTMTAMAVICYWFALPSLRAERLRDAFSQKKFSTIKIEGGGAEWRSLSDWGSDNQLRNASLSIAPLTMEQLWGGYRQVCLHIPHGDEMYQMDWDLSIIATRYELRLSLAMS